MRGRERKREEERGKREKREARGKRAEETEAEKKPGGTRKEDNSCFSPSFSLFGFDDGN